MKYLVSLSLLVAILSSPLITSIYALPLGGGSQFGSAGGYAGSGQAVQNNDYSHVSPGNQVINGGQQSSDLQGIAGNVLQGSNLLGLRR